MADFGPVILGGRGVLGEVAESPLSVTAQGLCQDQPALGLGEDAGIFLGAGVVNHGQCAVKSVGMVGRVHQDGAVCSVQPLADSFHDGVGLVGIRQTADDGPALGVQPEVGLGCGSFADPLAGLGEAPDEPVAVPAQLLDAALILGQLFIQPADILVGAAVGGKLPQNPHGVIELEGHKGRLAVGAQPQTVVPVGIQAGGQAVGAQMVQRKLHRPLEVLVDSPLILVGKGDHLVQEGEIAALSHIFVDGGEEPQSIIGPVGRMTGFLHIGGIVGGVLMAGVVGELDQGQAAAIVHLGRQHEANLLTGHFRLQMDDALNVLHRVAVAVAVPQAAVNQGGSPGPDKGDEAVIGVPGVQHGVEGGVRGLHLQVAEPAVPFRLEGVHFLLHLSGGVGIARQDGSSLGRGFHAGCKQDGFALAGSQLHLAGEGAAAVLVVAFQIAQIPGCHPLGVAIAVIRPQKGRLVPAVRGDRRTGQAEKPLGYRLVIHIFSLGQGVQVAVDLLGDPVAFKHSPADEEGILEVDLILLVVAVVGELSIACQGQAAVPVRVIGDGEGPDFISFALGHIVDGLGGDVCIAGFHPGVAHAVAALDLVVVQVFSHRLPGSGPEISALIIPQIDIPARLVKLVEHIPENPAVGTRPLEAVAAGVVGDDGAVGRRPQIVDPGGGGVGAVDHIFAGFVIKISVSHTRCFLPFGRYQKIIPACFIPDIQ